MSTRNPSGLGIKDSSEALRSSEDASVKSRGNQTNVVLDTSPERLYDPGYADNGAAPTRDGIVSIDATPDLSQPAKATLGSYLSNATRGQVYASRPNSFTVPEGSNSTDGTSYTVSENASTNVDPNRAVLQMRTAGTTIGTFMDLTKGLNQTAAAKFSSVKDSDYGGGDNPFVETRLKRVGTVERARESDGNTLLPSIQGNESGGPVDPGAPSIGPVPETAPLVQQKISEVLRQNRFNSIERAFVENHQRRVPGGYTVQRSMGQYNPNAPEVVEDKLHNVGQLLMIRATGHNVTGDLLSPTASGDIKALINLAPIVPSFTQITGLPLIDVGNLEARNVSITDSDTTSNPARSEYINKELGDLQVFAGNSYGVLNSDVEPFSDPYPIGTLTATVAGVVSLIALSTVIAIIPSFAVGETARGLRPRGAPIYPSQLAMGSYNSKEDESFILELLQIPRTDYPWGTCFIVGFGNFLGVEIEVSNGQVDWASVGEKFLEALLNFVLSPPGYYAGIVRNAVRSIEKIINAVTDAASAFAEANITGGLARLYSIITAVTGSASWKFVMAMAQVGNQLMNSTNSTYSVINYTSVSRDKPASDLHKRSRIKTHGKPTLAWSLSHRTRLNMSSYILPKTFTSAHKKMTDAASGNDLSLMRQLPSFLGSTNGDTRTTKDRFDPESVIEIERRLDAEYVPFYLHDLRTNEIISFSAFLNDLSDGFAANYTSTQGYGRADEVMIYNNTKRTMSLTFFVGATSAEDHSKMYWDINKIVSMVYPQYSRGRAMQSGELKFVQPFSQLPTASPMIRLRVGDIIKGNYSRFGLARLFGLGNNDVFNGDGDIMSAEKQAQIARERENATNQINQREERAKSAGSPGFSESDEVTIPPGEYTLVSLTGDEYQVPPAEFDPEDERQPAGSRYLYNTPITVKVIQILTPPVAPPTPRRTNSRRNRGRTVVSQAPNPERRYRVEVMSTNPQAPDVQDFKYHDVPHSVIQGFSEEYKQRLVSQQNASSGQQTDNQNASASTRNLAEFMSPEKNPLVRSFETTIGKGLAGFITDLKFDWADSTWATDEDGSKAPIFMKISLSFSPIHDIPMGLDSSGMMRSVAYNVGPASNMIGSAPYSPRGASESSTNTNTGG